MKKIIFLLLAFITVETKAQPTISGTFSPAEDFTWLIAYQLKPDTQTYIADAAIKNGEFILNLPEGTEAGTYRLVYAVPQEEYNFDVLYNGKEAIKLNFDAVNGLGFTQSEENILLNTYLAELAQIEREIIEFYALQKSDTAIFNAICHKLKAHQNSFESKSKGLLAHNFITSNQPYIPKKFETVQEYIANKKTTYFAAIDFNNSVLQSSDFLTDKVANYVFTAFPLNTTTKEKIEDEIIKNYIHIANFLTDINADFKFHIYHELWNYAVAYDYHKVSDFIYNTSLKKLAEETNNQEVNNTIEIHNRLRLGEIAPEIIWKNGSNIKKLSTLETAQHYVIIFWSSTCGHCLNELPALHKKLKENTSIRVLAVGLEDSTENWTLESAKLPDFEHAISLGKWDSEYANLYDIHGTPTYFILDKNKRIIAKPEDDKAVVTYLAQKVEE